jgi:hypothetical protein
MPCHFLNDGMLPGEPEAQPLPNTSIFNCLQPQQYCNIILAKHDSDVRAAYPQLPKILSSPSAGWLYLVEREGRLGAPKVLDAESGSAGSKLLVRAPKEDGLRWAPSSNKMQEDRVSMPDNTDATLYTRYFSLREKMNQKTQELQDLHKREVWLVPGHSDVHNIHYNGLPKLALLHYYCKRTEYRLPYIADTKLQKRGHGIHEQPKSQKKRATKTRNELNLQSAVVSAVYPTKSLENTTIAYLEADTADQIAATAYNENEEGNLFVANVWADGLR